MTFDITLMAQQKALLPFSPPWRGLLAAGVCAAWAWAVGMGLVVVNTWERR